MQRLTLQQSFANGLRNKPYVNSEFLVTSYALKPTEAGMVPFRAVDVLTDPANTTWPGNRIEEVGSTTLVFNADGINTVGTATVPSERIPVYDGVAVSDGVTDPTGFSSNSSPDGPSMTEGPNPDREPQALVKIAVRRGTSTATQFKVLRDTIYLGSWELTDDWTIATIIKPTDSAVTYSVLPVTGAGTVEYECKVHWAAPFADFGYWNFVKSEEFNDVWFAQAGTDEGRFMLYHVPSNGIVGAHSSMKWVVFRLAGGDLHPTYTNSRVISSMARHMGRMYFAGFHPDNPQYQTTIASDGAKSWEYFWNSFLENTDVELTHEGMKIGKNVIFYSKLNGGDYFWPFAVELAMFSCPSVSAFEDAVPFLLDAVRKKEIGFFEIPTVGVIQRIESAGNALYVFATDGVYIVGQNQTDFGTGHAVFKVSDVPLKGISAAINKGIAIYFINANDRLCIANEEGVQVLGYQSQLKTLEDEIQMDYDNEEDDLYISGSNKCFVLTRTGLGEYGAPVNSVVSQQGTLTGYAGVPNTEHGNVVAVMLTESLDFIERMLKGLHSMELGISNAINIRYRIHYRTHGLPSWEVTEWIDVYDTSGFVTPIVSGHDMRIELKFELQGYEYDEYTKLEYVNLNWRRSDKRNFRLHRSGRV